MSTRMLIDAAHREETRVAIVRGSRIEEFDFEAANKSTLRGNIYLARVTRVEPSLQAAFVEYGGNRHGFLAFSEIHPDYYQIPVEDRQALLEEEERERASQQEDEDDGETKADGDSEDGPEVEELGSEDALDDVDEGPRKTVQRRYKIQEVIKKRQILLVQVVKEERGNKGAALTTYLSLAGRYCVLMPNTARGGGISRKIPHSADRKRLKKIMSDLDVPKGMGCIIRTAGASRTKTEIKRDYTYLIRLWDNIRTLTMESIAPALIYEEGDLIKRAIRDMYSSEIEEVLVEGDGGYRSAKDFMKMLMPSHAKRVQQYKDDLPLFQRYQVESQLEVMYSATVPLKSGGYLVINPTEALVAVDVNSGRSTRERNIEKTALKTNLEAAEEVARQLRLRDLAGLIVIDFIDMDENRNNRSVERKMKECLKSDRARLQVGRISPFGLLEMSRQRLRPGLLEASTETCPVCSGTGAVRSVESSALQLMRAIEDEGIKGRARQLAIQVPEDVGAYILNNKRHELVSIENRFDLQVELIGNPDLHRPHYELSRSGQASGEAKSKAISQSNTVEDTETAEETSSEKPRRSRRGKKDERDNTGTPRAEASGDGEDEPRKRRRRGRRGGRRRRKDNDAVNNDAIEAGSATDTPTDASAQESQDGGTGQQAPQDSPVPASGTPQQPETTAQERAQGENDPGTDDAPASAEPDQAQPRKQADGPPEDQPDVAVEKAPEWQAKDPVTAASAAAEESPADPPSNPDQPLSPTNGSGDSGDDAEPLAADAQPPAPVEDEYVEDEYTGPRRTGWWNRRTS